MKYKHHLIIFITCLLSVTYIFAIDIYDTKGDFLHTLYEASSNKDIHMHHFVVTLTTAEKIQKNRINNNRKQEVDRELSHMPSCSKLCTNVHPIPKKEDRKYHFDVVKEGERSSYIKYRLRIDALDGIEEADNLRYRGISLYEKWGGNINETIVLQGTMQRQMNNWYRKSYVDMIMKKLDGKIVGMYQDDLNPDIQVYYAFTNKYNGDSYVLNTKDTNMQIGFYYNNVLNQTEIIIAFPFYNEPF